MGPNKRSNETFILDKDKLLSAIRVYFKRYPNRNHNFFIWGGEPLVHFEELKQTVFFLKENFPNKRISFSTNGFLLRQKEIRNFIFENNLRLQLSIDGIAQYVRSNFNPLEDDIISLFLTELAHKNLLTINCVMHNKNFSIKANIDYFSNWMIKYDCLDSKLNIRFTPFNESNLTPDFNLSGRQLTIFINEFEELYFYALLGNHKDAILNHFIRFPLKIIKESNFNKCNWDDYNQCTRFFSGKSKISNHIDTKGNFITCNLIDSGVAPRGKKVKIFPKYCKNCEFYKMRGCWPCPAGDFAERCEWKKAWMQLQKRMLYLKNLLKD